MLTVTTYLPVLTQQQFELENQKHSEKENFGSTTLFYVYALYSLLGNNKLNGTTIQFCLMLIKSIQR